MAGLLAVFRNLRLRLNVKIDEESGMGTVLDATNGKVVTFTKSFADVTDVFVTGKYNSSYGVTGVYDFVDAPNPTQMTVYLYRTDTGAKITGDFSWKVKGIVND